MIVTWIESAVAAGFRDVRIVSGSYLDLIRSICGDGARWGCTLTITDKAPADAPAPRFHSPAFLYVADGRLRGYRLNSLKAWFECSLDIVEGRRRLAAQPGYSLVSGEWVGLEPRLSPSCWCEAPVMLGDRVRLDSFSRVGPAAVVGSDVLIGRGSHVERSLVLDHTYVGEGLRLEGRIASGDRLIDPEDGTYMELDDLLLADLRERANRSLWQKVRGAFG